LTVTRNQTLDKMKIYSAVFLLSLLQVSSILAANEDVSLTLLADINKGSGPSIPRFFTSYRDLLYFSADNPAVFEGENVLYQSNLTAEGTMPADQGLEAGLTVDANNPTVVPGVGMFFTASLGQSDAGEERPPALFIMHESGAITELLTEPENGDFRDSSFTVLKNMMAADDMDAPEGFLVFWVRSTSGTDFDGWYYASDGTASGTTEIRPPTLEDTWKAVRDPIWMEDAGVAILFYGEESRPSEMQLWAVATDIADIGMNMDGNMTTVDDESDMMMPMAGEDNATFTFSYLATVPGNIPDDAVSPEFGEMGSRLFGVQRSNPNEESIWISDGTAEGTMLHEAREDWRDNFIFAKDLLMGEELVYFDDCCGMERIFATSNSENVNETRVLYDHTNKSGRIELLSSELMIISNETTYEYEVYSTSGDLLFDFSEIMDTDDSPSVLFTVAKQTLKLTDGRSIVQLNGFAGQQIWVTDGSQDGTTLLQSTTFSDEVRFSPTPLLITNETFVVGHVGVNETGGSLGMEVFIGRYTHGSTAATMEGGDSMLDDTATVAKATKRLGGPR